MPRTIRYTRERLITALKSSNWSEWFENTRAQSATQDIADVVKQAVAYNTFRAFRGLKPQRPSLLFREWALRTLDEKFLAQLLACKNGSDYRQWVFECSSSLRQCWPLTAKDKEMSFGPSLKLQNLLAKRLCASPVMTGVDAERIIPLLDVPLDSFTIQAVADSLTPSDLSRIGIGKVPRTASMGFISTPERYEVFQDVIRDCAQSAEVPAIAIDCLAYDDTHVSGAPIRNRKQSKVCA